MRGAKLCSSLTLLVCFCTGCMFHKSSPPQQAQAPPLQTGKGTLNPPTTAQQQPKTDTPLASPLPAPSAQSVPLPPPPPPKKVKHKSKPPVVKPPDTAQTPASGGGSQSVSRWFSICAGHSPASARDCGDTVAHWSIDDW